MLTAQIRFILISVYKSHNIGAVAVYCHNCQKCSDCMHFIQIPGSIPKAPSWPRSTVPPINMTYTSIEPSET